MPASAEERPFAERSAHERDARALPPAAALGRPPKWQELKARRAVAPEGLPPFVQLEDHEWTRVALGLAAAGPARPIAWRLGPDTVAGALGTSGVSPPPPFEAAAPGSAADRSGLWLLRKDGTAIDSLPPTPRVLAAGRRAGLVTLWTRDGIRCLFDVTAAGSIGIDGPPVAAGSALSELVVELGSRRWSDLEEVYLVGFGRELHGLDGIHFLAEVRDALELLRTADRHGSPSRCLVVAPALPGSGDRGNLASLIALAGQIESTSVVCCEPSLAVRTVWRLAARGETLHLELRHPLGSVVLFDPRDDREPRPLSHEQADTPADEEERARQPGADASEDADAPARAAYADPLARRFSDGPFVMAKAPVHEQVPDRREEVEIMVLGMVDVVGTDEPVHRRPRLTELLVYLAFHREGLLRDSFGAALWPERRISSQTIANRLHEARRALGTSRNGRSRLGRVRGQLRLGDDVVTDWERFEELTSDGSGPQSWRLALSLVRGRPFLGLAHAEWTVLEGHVAAMERAIVETALALGDYFLSADNPPAADWAAQQALLASPWDERLYRLLMRSAEAAGNRGAIDAALRSLASVLELSGDPLLGVHPTTARLYRSLTGRGGDPPARRPPR